MDRRRFDTVIDLLNYAFSQYRDVSAFTCMGHSLSYGEIDRLSGSVASFFQHHTSLQPGDRVAVQLPNVLAYPVVAFGAVRAGLVLVNTNPLYTARELRHQLKDSGAKALVVLANVAHVAAEVIPDTDVQQVVVVEVGDLLPWPKRLAVNLAVRYIKKMVPPYHLPQALSLNEVLAAGSKPFDAPAVEPSSLFALQYTGGTTGVAKGAMLSHANLCANVDQVLERIRTPFAKSGEVAVAALPLYHIYAFTMHLMCAFCRGANNVLIPNPRDLPALVGALKKCRVSLFVGVNTLYAALARYPGTATLDFSQVKVSSAGGMAITEDTTRRWKALTGTTILEGYGLSETSPVVCCNPDTAIEPGTIGPALKDTLLKVVDESGAEVPQGEAGELLVKGPQVMLGYWHSEQATAQVMSDGWFKTGDIVQKRSDGYYKLVDRKKDIINVSGFKVFPNEVEDVVCQHPGVLEAAVVGVPMDDEHGERVKAFVVVTDKNLTQEDILAHCRKSLTAYKVPKFVEFRDQLPKSNVGKILRKDLRPVPAVKVKKFE